MRRRRISASRPRSRLRQRLLTTSGSGRGGGVRIIREFRQRWTRQSVSDSLAQQHDDGASLGLTRHPLSRWGRASQRRRPLRRCGERVRPRGGGGPARTAWLRRSGPGEGPSAWWLRTAASTRPVPARFWARPASPATRISSAAAIASRVCSRTCPIGPFTGPSGVSRVSEASPLPSSVRGRWQKQPER